ncbi:hypothetical protein HMN09_00477500 [Mycena chlorophos]|uniref:Uncharacterized protein n=1 Tax=Mycena chlorophos TaxID=658473 RepID=A0A8H6TIQ1_MYCCL|nr:hypothetical protein HMN09_00477500 [Mycena chlorophos]
MLWLPTASKMTPSGRMFADFFQSRVFSIGPVLRDAVHAESDARGDEEPPSADMRSQSASRRGNGEGWMEGLSGLRASVRRRPGPASRAHRKRRQERQAKVVAEGHAPRPAAYARHAVELSTLPTMLESQELPVEWGAYRAGMPDARELRGSKKARSVDDFLRLGFQVVQWNGMYVTYTSN